MSRCTPLTALLFLALTALACGGSESAKPRGASGVSLSTEERDAELLGREIFDLVDRAMDYRGSHEGRPANNLRQMGVESLTTLTVRRMANVQREPVIAVAFRQPSGREVVACLGGRQVLEDAFLNSGRFTITCTLSSGAQRPIEVGGSAGR